MKISSIFLPLGSSRILNQIVEPEVIIPGEVINIPEYYEKDVDLSCLGQANLPNGGRFSSPGWEDQYAYANNMNCTWVLGRSGCTTEIDFYEVDIEDLHLLRKCPYDKLTLRTYDHQLYRELCGRSPPEILRVFGPIEVNFQSDKTVQRRGWTAAVNIYDCNYPHLENNHWRHKSKKISRKKTYHSSTIPSTLSTITTTTTTTTTETTTAETTAFIETSTETTETVPTTTVQQQTQFETSNPTESFTSESAQTEFHTVAQYFTNASTVEATYDFFTEEISTTQKPFENETTESADNETFDDLTDKIDVTLNRIEDWSKDLSNFTKELESEMSGEGSGEDISKISVKMSEDENSALNSDYNPLDYLADGAFRGDQVNFG